MSTSGLWQASQKNQMADLNVLKFLQLFKWGNNETEQHSGVVHDQLDGLSSWRGSPFICHLKYVNGSTMHVSSVPLPDGRTHPPINSSYWSPLCYINQMYAKRISAGEIKTTLRLAPLVRMSCNHTTNFNQMRLLELFHNQKSDQRIQVNRDPRRQWAISNYTGREVYFRADCPKTQSYAVL
jgi:hypothetical protein